MKVAYATSAQLHPDSVMPKCRATCTTWKFCYSIAAKFDDCEQQQLNNDGEMCDRNDLFGATTTHSPGRVFFFFTRMSNSRSFVTENGVTFVLVGG